MSDITNREQLINALLQAATLEQGIICQYLFAAFSLKTHPQEGNITWPQLEYVREWKAGLLLIARQEMEHLGLVCNLLSQVGGSADFQHPSFPYRNLSMHYSYPYSEFCLQRFAPDTLQRFIGFERSHVCVSGATEGIGALYQNIRTGFMELHAKNPRFLIGAKESQINNPDIGIPAGHFDINLVKVLNLESALQAIDQIVATGGQDTAAGQPCHSDRFQSMYQEFELLRGDDPCFEPARAVVINPVSRLPAHDASAVTFVQHPQTQAAMILFNQAYAAMNQMLVRFYTHTDHTQQEQLGLVKTAFFPLMTAVLRPLGEILTRMPVNKDVRLSETAGPAFESGYQQAMHPFKRSSWVLFHERLQNMAESCEQLCQGIDSNNALWAKAIYPRLAFLQENLHQIAVNFERYMNLRHEHVRHMIGRLL